jgi:C1A family cysteine protease
VPAAVTAVKNQGQCGSCWAFSVTENIESMWILAGKANSSIALAPQQIVDCDNSDDGCNGGEPPTAYQYVINAGGLETNESYPYTAEGGSCTFSKSLVVASIASWKYATSSGDETTLQKNLLGYGPLSICLDASNWQDYQSGVLTAWECAWVDILDHCVQLVGYNSTTTEYGSPYWIGNPPSYSPFSL